MISYRDGRHILQIWMRIDYFQIVLISVAGQPKSHVQFPRASISPISWMMNVSMYICASDFGEANRIHTFTLSPCEFLCVLARARACVCVCARVERTAKFGKKINDYFVFNRHVLGYVLQRVDTHLLNRLNEFSVSIFLVLFSFFFCYIFSTSSRTTTS